MSDAGAADALVGRSRELEQIEAALTRASGRSHALVLTGDPGIGKSRLLAEACRRVEGDGVAALRGACIDVGDSWPFHVVRQALHAFAAHNPETPRSVQRMMELLDDEGHRPDSGGVLADLHRNFVELAAGRRLLFVLDDLQWVDDSTRRLLLTLLAGVSETPILLLAAVRTEDAHGDAPVRRLLRELRRAGTATVLELQPLDMSLTAELAVKLADVPLSTAVTAAVWRRSGGNPLVVEQLVRHGFDSQVVPDSLRQALLSRVECLPTPAQELVRTLAVAAGHVSHEVLVQVWDQPEPALVTNSRLAVTARLLLIDEEGYRLRHQLLNEVLQQDLLPAERAAIHRRFAVAIEASQPADRHGQLAYHWRGAGDLTRALKAVVRAAEDANRINAIPEASRLWQEAVEISAELRGDKTSPHLLLQAAEASHRAGDHATALGLVDAALADMTSEPDADPTARVKATMQRAGYLAAAGRLRLAQREYEDIVAVSSRDPDLRSTAAAHSAELLVRMGDYRRAGKLALLATHVSDEGGVASTQVLANAALAWSRAYRGELESARTTLMHALRVAEESHSPAAIGAAYLHLSELLVGPLNELDAGIQVARAGAALCAQNGGTSSDRIALLATAANGLFRVGRWQEAAETTSAALATDPTHVAAVDMLLARARTIMALGDLQGAERDLRAAETLLADQGGSRQSLPLATLRAGLALWHRDPVAARAAVRIGLETAPDLQEPWLCAPLIWHGLRAEADSRADGFEADDEGKDRLLEAMMALDSGPGTGSDETRKTVSAYSDLCAAEASRIGGSSDPVAWQRAAMAWSTLAHPYPTAYALMRQAEAWFAQRARNQEASNALRQAHSIAARLYAAPLIAEIEALAARARVKLPASASVSPGGSAEVVAPPARSPGGLFSHLTRREREVLTLVAAGCSNREIGARLFISERTAGVHVSRLLAKLHVRSRVEAASLYLRAIPRAAEGGIPSSALWKEVET